MLILAAKMWKFLNIYQWILKSLVIYYKQSFLMTGSVCVYFCCMYIKKFQFPPKKAEGRFQFEGKKKEERFYFFYFG